MEKNNDREIFEKKYMLGEWIGVGEVYGKDKYSAIFSRGKEWMPLGEFDTAELAGLVYDRYVIEKPNEDVIFTLNNPGITVGELDLKIKVGRETERQKANTQQQSREREVSAVLGIPASMGCGARQDVCSDEAQREGERLARLKEKEKAEQERMNAPRSKGGGRKTKKRRKRRKKRRTRKPKKKRRKTKRRTRRKRTRKR